MECDDGGKVKRDFASLEGREFDLLIIGGGIYGAWTAYDAALRGLKVAIVEQGDWASATSSASSKLIHGGLRYLETYDFKLVRKALRERQMLLKIAPHRVWPLRFGVPVYEDSRVGRLQLKAGLTLYDLLAGCPKSLMSHRRFGKTGFAKRFPFLRDEKLKGGFTYGDAQTDDARLVLELIAGAMDAGAVCVNYCLMTEYVEADGQVSGAVVQDSVTHSSVQVMARQVVNTSGRWATATEQVNAWCRLSKGIHLVMPALPTDEALLLTAQSDGRVFFAIPWYGRTLLGTTDTDYHGDLGKVTVEAEDVAYLLAEANQYLNTGWAETDVIGSYAGVRVMKCSDAESPSEISRDWELKTDSKGIQYSIGGKITSAREDASVIVDSVCSKLGILNRCTTMNRPFPWLPSVTYEMWQTEVSARAEQLGIDNESAFWLMRRQGKRVDEVLKLVEQTGQLAERIVPSLPFIYGDLLLCAQDEMVIHLEDLLRRRVPLSILARLSDEKLRQIANIVAPVLKWDEETINREIIAFS
ncbi:MAG: glycerol-3-phosphate dehydrogenase/oxidase [Gallionella sp.]